MVGVYTFIAETDISEAEPLDGSPVQNEAQLPHHLVDLYMQAKENCAGRDQEEKLSGLLVQYQDVFSKGADYMGRTSLVKHSIPVADGTRSIRQPPTGWVRKKRLKQRSKSRGC